MPSHSQAMPSDSQVHQKRFLNRCRICHGGEVGFQLGGSASQLGEKSGQEISWESIAVLLPCCRAAVRPCRRVAASVGLPHGGCHLWPSPVAAMLPQVNCNRCLNCNRCPLARHDNGRPDGANPTRVGTVVRTRISGQHAARLRPARGPAPRPGSGQRWAAAAVSRRWPVRARQHARGSGPPLLSETLSRLSAGGARAVLLVLTMPRSP